jgi:hypothetical protein
MEHESFKTLVHYRPNVMLLTGRSIDWGGGGLRAQQQMLQTLTVQPCDEDD